MNDSEMVFNPNTGKFEIPPTHKSNSNSKSKSSNISLNIEDIPRYTTETINNHLKRYPIRKPRNKYEKLQTYEDPHMDPYIYMGILYKYSLRLLDMFDKYGPSSLDIIIDRYNKLNKIDISLPYVEKDKNIIHKIFKNTLNNHFMRIKNEYKDTKENLLLRIEFNKEIHNDIRHLSELIYKNEINTYKVAFNAFTQKYFTDGIMEMLNEIYINNKNDEKHGDMKKLKDDLLKKHQRIMSKPISRKRSKNLKKSRTTSKKRANLLNVVPGKVI
jgi:hypothetical protein